MYVRKGSRMHGGEPHAEVKGARRHLAEVEVDADAIRLAEEDGAETKAEAAVRNVELSAKMSLTKGVASSEVSRDVMCAASSSRHTGARTCVTHRAVERQRCGHVPR